jgi:hypothetical protein
LASAMAKLRHMAEMQAPRSAMDMWRASAERLAETVTFTDANPGKQGRQG